MNVYSRNSYTLKRFCNLTLSILVYHVAIWSPFVNTSSQLVREEDVLFKEVQIARSIFELAGGEAIKTSY